jgi:hypothetical protein
MTALQKDEQVFDCNGIKLIGQNAFIDNIFIGGEWKTVYMSFAKDAQDNDYRLIWQITHPDPENCDDESEMCDWDNFEVEIL